MSPPRVSSVIPFYNRPKLLKRAVDSVIAQSYQNIELIVVDDASTNATVETALSGRREEMDNRFERVVLHRHERNLGVSVARNTGVELSNGEYVAFLDDDDVWEPRKINKQIRVMSEDGVGLVYCGVRRVGPDGAIRSVYKPSQDGNVIRNLLMGNITGTTSTVLLEKTTALDVGGFDPAFLRWNDWDFAIRVAKRRPFGVVSEPLVRQYSSDGTQLSSDHEKLEISAERLLDKHQELAKEHDCIPVFRAHVNWGLGYSAMMNGLYPQSRKHFLKAIRYYPIQPKFYLYFLVSIGGKYAIKPLQFLTRKFTRMLTESSWKGF